MIEHIVLFKLKPTMTESMIQSFTETLLSMAGQIPGIVEMSAGQNNSPEGLNQAYDYGMIVRFVDAAARDTYLPHPVHQKIIKETIEPNIDGVLVLDYEHS